MWIYDYQTLLKVRKQQDRTRRDVCAEDRLNVTQHTLRMWELGKQAPRADYLALLATVYNVEPMDFFRKK